MRWTRFYTEEGRDFCADGLFRAVVPENHHFASQQTYIVPQHWNPASVDVLLEKVFYPHALPAMFKRVPEEKVPGWLWRSAADHAALDGVSAEWRFNIEKDIRAVVQRIAGSVTYNGWKLGLFTAENDARIFYDELRYILLHQIAAPELKQWQQLGLDWAYGLAGAPYAPQSHTEFFTQDTTQVLRRLILLGETLALENTEAKTNVILPIENPESLSFINWKKTGDIRQAAESLGQRVLESAARHVMDACDRDNAGGFDPAQNFALAEAIGEARRAGLPEAAIRMAIDYAEQGFEDISFPLPLDEKTAYDCLQTTVSLPDEFIESALTGHGFSHRPAQKIWDALAEAIWSSGEPAVSFRSSTETANEAAAAAPAALINLSACATGKEIVNTGALQHVTRVMTVMLETLSAGTISLGVTNIAALLMSKGLAYDSDAGRATAALATGFVSGAAYHASAELALLRGSFADWTAASKNYLQGVKNKMAALSGGAYLQKGLMRRPVQLRPALCPDVFLAEAVKQVWDEAYRLGKESGFRHQELTGLAGERWTETLLGAQTPGISAVVAQLHGKHLNPLVPAALKALGYGAAEIDDIYFHAAGHGTLLDAPFINHASLRARGLPQATLDAIESALATSLHIRYAFNRWTLGEDFCRRVLNFADADIGDDAFDMLSALGFSEGEIAAANNYCCGAMNLAGAPHIKATHVNVFDCNVSPLAQVKMQAALEPFLSAAVAHTVRLAYEAKVEDVQQLILSAWEMGVKQLRLYRDNGSLLHAIAVPLTTLAAKNNIEEYQDASSPAGKKSA